MKGKTKSFMLIALILIHEVYVLELKVDQGQERSLAELHKSSNHSKRGSSRGRRSLKGSRSSEGSNRTRYLHFPPKLFRTSKTKSRLLSISKMVSHQKAERQLRMPTWLKWVLFIFFILFIISLFSRGSKKNNNVKSRMLREMKNKNSKILASLLKGRSLREFVESQQIKFLKALNRRKLNIDTKNAWTNLRKFTANYLSKTFHIKKQQIQNFSPMIDPTLKIFFKKCLKNKLYVRKY